MSPSLSSTMRLLNADNDAVGAVDAVAKAMLCAGSALDCIAKASVRTAPAEGPSCALPKHISTAEFAQAFNISRQKASEACRRMKTGKPWRGLLCEILTIQGRGGKSGEQHRILTASLPEPIRERFRRSANDNIFDLTELAASIRTLGSQTLQSANMAAKWAAIERVLEYPFKSKERAEAVRRAAESHNVSPRTIYEWVSAYEADGFRGLEGRPRSRSTKQLLISRAFDAAFSRTGRDIGQLQQLTHAMTEFVRGCWVSPVAAKGARHIQRAAEDLLKEKCRELGLEVSESAIKLSSKIVARERDYELVAIEDHDPRHFRNLRPRIRRTIDGLVPMEVVYIDVKHGDVWFESHRKMIRCAKIGFYDAAVDRLFTHILKPRNGGSVTPEEMFEALLMMIRQWGIPRLVYFDHGHENDVYQGTERRDMFIGAAARLNAIPQLREMIAIKARPNNPQAKTIEAKFARTNKAVYSQIPGFLAPLASRPGSLNPRRRGHAFPGTFSDYVAEVKRHMTAYHVTGGERSPAQRYERFCADGFEPRMLPDEVLTVALGNKETRSNDLGKVEFAGDVYTNDLLCEVHPGRSVNVFHPIGDNAAPCVQTADGRVEPLRVDAPYRHTDRAGLAESNRRQELFQRSVDSLRRSALPVDPRQIAERCIANRRIEGVAERHLQGETYISAEGEFQNHHASGAPTVAAAASASRRMAAIEHSLRASL